MPASDERQSPQRNSADTRRPLLPVSTYRLQFHSGFTFADAVRVVPYLADLGVTHCYCSPIFTATPGSTHGYDVCRHTEINPELGGEGGFMSLAAELDRHGLGCILDFVPNHMSNDPHTNHWWRDVLENGPSSAFARFFDIDWDPTKPELKDRLLLPVLGEQYGEVLERGGLRLSFEAGTVVLAYGSLSIPINPRRIPVVLEHDIGTLETELGTESPELREFLSILTALRNLPPYTERDEQKIAERHREKEIARERLAALASTCADVRSHIERALTSFNGTPGDPRSFDRLHELLEQQAYRLASWRTAADEINYRRFFDINELAGLRVEDPVVFDELHGLLLRLLASGVACGVRLDHIDGLFDPRTYLQRLAEATTRAVDSSVSTSKNPVVPTCTSADIYITVEKILSTREPLREGWPVAGTTGYTFLNDVNGLFVDGRHAKKMQRVYARLTGHHGPFADVAYEGKRLIVVTALSSEFQVLAHSVNRISEADRRSRDFTLANIRRALREVVACFPVYRTYVDGAGGTAEDSELVDGAIAEARRRNPAMESSIFDFLRGVLLPHERDTSSTAPSSRAVDRHRCDVAMRFQQYTAPVQAKGVEDTAFYRYHLLASLNEVGGDPGRFGRSVAEFHTATAHRRRHWPREMLATTTHDTKRSEDARARINVLSERPDLWQSSVARWRRLNRSNRSRLARNQAPDANDEYLFYQALVGAWPAERIGDPIGDRAAADLVERLGDFMRKAIREAKLHTSWITPNLEYEAAVARFVERTLTGRTAPAFLASFVPFVRHVATAGMYNSLSQLVLKIASPGVADFYQGTELWDLSLVDPDNRRPVDFDRRSSLLKQLQPWLDTAVADPQRDSVARERLGGLSAMLEEWPEGRLKLLVTAIGMRLRRARPALFLDGTYEPLEAVGPRSSHVVAFARRLGADVLIVVAPRLTTQIPWHDGRVPCGSTAWDSTTLHLPADTADCAWRELITGARLSPSRSGTGFGALPLERVLESCPVALLLAEETPGTKEG
jgi:(1->4)-alpha-D-glucan 1-alpha-D-glucosylmutase